MDLSVKIIKLSGILDLIAGNELRQQVNELVNEKIDILLLDFKEVKFVTSSGLSSLIAIIKVINNANGKICVCSIEEQPKMLFEMTNMDSKFQVFADQDHFKRQMLAINSSDVINELKS